MVSELTGKIPKIVKINARLTGNEDSFKRQMEKMTKSEISHAPIQEVMEN